MTNPPRKGIACPKHPDARLRVTHVQRVGIGVVHRYRACTAKNCTYRVGTKETIRPKGGCRKAKNNASA
jgi:hypothetical protein